MHTHCPPAALANIRSAAAAAAASALNVLTCVGLSLARELVVVPLCLCLVLIVVSVHCVRKTSENPLARSSRSAVPLGKHDRVTPGLVLLHTFLHPLLCTV